MCIFEGVWQGEIFIIKKGEVHLYYLDPKFIGVGDLRQESVSLLAEVLLVGMCSVQSTLCELPQSSSLTLFQKYLHMWESCKAGVYLEC